MLTNVFSNFNFIDTLDENKLCSEAFVNKRSMSILRTVDTYLNHISNWTRFLNHPAAKYTEELHAALCEDHWVTTDRDFFGMLADIAQACFASDSNYQVLCEVVHIMAYLPLDVECNGTPARRYMEILCESREKPDSYLYEYSAAIAVFMYLYKRIMSCGSAETWIRRHWRFGKSSNIATLSLAMMKHSPADYFYADRVASTFHAELRILKWTSEMFACMYSRIIVPAILDGYGDPCYRAAHDKFLKVGGCHEDN